MSKQDEMEAFVTNAGNVLGNAASEVFGGSPEIIIIVGSGAEYGVKVLSNSLEAVHEILSKLLVTIETDVAVELGVEVKH